MPASVFDSSKGAAGLRGFEPAWTRRPLAGPHSRCDVIPAAYAV